MAGNGVSRAYIDTAGGTILVGNPDFFLDGFPVAVEGNPVEDHGNNEHSNAIMVNGTPSFLINGIPVCTASSQASCGHQATGSASFTVGSSGRGSESRQVPTAAPPYQPTAESPAEVSNPIFVSTWRAPVSGAPAETYSPELLTDADFESYKYVKPMIWLCLDGANYYGPQSGYVSIPAQKWLQDLPTSTGLNTRMNSTVNALNRLPKGMRVLAPRYYQEGYVYYKTETDKLSNFAAFMSANPPDAPGDFNTYPGPGVSGDRAVGVMLFNRKSDNISVTGTGWTMASIWGATAVNQLYQDSRTIFGLLKSRGAKIDYFAFDTEGNPGSIWNNYPSTPPNTKLLALQAIESDPRANQSWYGARSLISILKQDGKYPNNTAERAVNDIHAQRSPSYIYWNGALHTIKNASIRRCFFDSAREFYPEIGVSNYDSFKVNDLDWGYDPNGHPVFQENPAGDGASPVLYMSWNAVTDSGVWGINPLDDTQLVYKTWITPNPPAFKNSIWKCLLLDIQQLRAAKRGDPSAYIRPWIRPRQWGGDAAFVPGIATGQADSPASGQRFYYEMIRHCAATGAQHFYSWNYPDNTTALLNRNGAELDALMIEINDILGGYSPNTVTTKRVSFNSEYVVSGTKSESGKNAGKYVWRITPKPGLTLISQTGRPLTVDSDGGAWLVTTSPIVPTYTVQTNQSGTSGR